MPAPKVQQGNDNAQASRSFANDEKEKLITWRRRSTYIIHSLKETVMQSFRLSNKIRRIIMLSPEEEEQRPSTNPKEKKKKFAHSEVSGKSRAQPGKANNAYTSTYLKRHKKSSRKKKDGWLRDLTTICIGPHANMPKS